MYFYPEKIPLIDISKIKHLKKYTNNTTMLYSSEGLFQIKSGKLLKVHFNDDKNTFKKCIGSTNFICDNSDIIWTPCNKIPYNFKKKEIVVNCYEKGNAKLYLELINDRINHIYFYIKDPSLYGTENDIIDILKCAKNLK